MKIILLVLLLAIPVHAQSNDRLRQTWKSPDMSRKDHDAELARDGYPFNLGNAMGILITFGLLANGRADVASKEDVPKVFRSVEQAMARMPAVAAMSELEKQRLYDC